jgi:hypothetical protein
LADDIQADAIETMLGQLKNGEEVSQKTALQLLPGSIQQAMQQQVDGAFGRGFFANVASLPIGEWAGPVRSGFGYHLIRLDALEPAQMPSLDAVRDKVLSDWRHSLAGHLTEAHMAALMESYKITRPSANELSLWSAQ